MDLHPLFPAPRRAPEIVSLLGWLGAFCEASPGRATHPRPAVRPGNGDGERKANPHPKSHPERTLPPSRKCEALGPCPDPLVHPIPPSSPATSQQSQPSRAQPLRHEPVPSEQRDPGHTPGPAFSQEAASCTRPRGTIPLGASHRACRTQRVPGRLHACASEPTYRHSPRDGRGFLFFPLVALALPLAQGPLPTFFGPGGGVSVLGRSSRSCSCWGGVRFLPPPCLDW